MNPAPRPSFSLPIASPAGPAAVDPVCGMTVDPATAPAKVEHEGRTYSFCSTSCAHKFEADPHRYLHGGPVGMTEPAPAPHPTLPHQRGEGREGGRPRRHGGAPQS